MPSRRHLNKTRLEEMACQEAQPDAVARAIIRARATALHVLPDQEQDAVTRESWLALLQALARAKVAEAAEAAQTVSGFQWWGGRLGRAAGGPLFPAAISDELRDLLGDVSLSVIHEQDLILWYSNLSEFRIQLLSSSSQFDFDMPECCSS